MLDVPLAKRMLKVAKPLMPRVASPLSRAKPLPAAGRAVRAVRRFSDSHGCRFSVEVIRFKAKRRRNARRILGMHGLIAMMVCMSQVVVQEAPAWALSMVVHMVTLVTMAMVVVPETVPDKPQHLSLCLPRNRTSKRSWRFPTSSRKHWTTTPRPRR